MEKANKLSILGIIFLLTATLAWGSSFYILKETINECPPIYVIGIRFFVGGILACLIFIKRLIKINKGVFLRGMVIGLVVAGAYLTQTLGLTQTSAGTNAFLTSLYCVICPFLFWIFYKQRPKNYNFISMGLCALGLGLIAFSGDDTGTNTAFGIILTLVCSVFYALQIFFVDKYQSNNDDSFQLFCVELLTVGVVLLAISFIFELPIYTIKKYALTGQNLFNVIYLTLICTVYAQLAQNLGQKYAGSSRASIILSLEAVFGAIFSLILGGENPTVFLIVGFIVIFSAIMITELKIDFVALFKPKPKQDSQ